MKIIVKVRIIQKNAADNSAFSLNLQTQAWHVS